MESDTEIIVVPLRQMLLFEKLYAKNFADMLVRFGSIIETCNKINGYWESDGWTEIYEDMADKSDRMNEIVDDMSCLLYTSPSPRDRSLSRKPSSA